MATKRTIKKYAKGGEGDDPVTPTKSTSATSATKSASQLGSMTGKEYRAEKKGIKRAQKLDRIASGKQGERVDNVIKAVGSGAEAVANVAGAVGKTREAFGPDMRKMGGSVKKMADGGFPITKKAAARKAEKGKGILVGGSRGKGQYVPYTKAGRKEVKETGGTEVYNLKSVRKVMKTGGMTDSKNKVVKKKPTAKYAPATNAGGGTYIGSPGMIKKRIMKTGGMVNSNTNATVSKVASGRPAKSAEPKTAAKKATGKVGGISKAPRAAAPKMKMGGSMKRK